MRFVLRSRTLPAIHEHGTPVMHIPARPVIRPALSQASVRAEMGQVMLDACAAALDGDRNGVTAALEESGQAGVDGIHAYIDAGIPPPNAPVTLTGGWIRNPVSGKPVKVKGKSGTTSATSMVATPHRGDRSLSVDLTSFETSATGGQKEVRPLVDTGQLYNDFDFEIREK